jgi:hypothetical protein
MDLKSLSQTNQGYQGFEETSLIKPIIRQIVFLFACFFAFFTIFYFTKVSSKGYIVSELEEKNTQLEEEIKKNEIDFVVKKSISANILKIDSDNFTEVDDLKYLKTESKSISKK